jgi:crotonobetainyl-CoA:carnitine CoA-transferase CaiB-like acyl-CoA transferase
MITPSVKRRTRRPLEGTRVLELGELIAGPFIGTLLAEFGAEVIKIERPGRGDLLRQFGPMVDGTSVFWQVNSRNKKSVVLDLNKPNGIAVLEDLVKHCDIAVFSMRPGSLEARGIDQEKLKRLNPRLVIVFVSAFGRRGPNSGKGGYDPIGQGYSGLSYLTGDPDGPPMRAGGAIPVCDFMTGLLGAFGAVLSLFDNKGGPTRRSERSQVVDVALYDMAFRMIGPLLTYFDATGKAWHRDGNHSLAGAPTGHFITKEGDWLCVSVQNDEQFARCARLVGHIEWVQDARFSTLENRTKHRDAINVEVAKWIAERNRSATLTAFEQAGLPAGPINSITDIAADAHIANRGIKRVTDPALGEVRVPDIVPCLSESPGYVNRPAPRLGEHTHEVLSELLGYSRARQESLASEGVTPQGDSGFRRRYRRSR